MDVLVTEPSSPVLVSVKHNQFIQGVTLKAFQRRHLPRGGAHQPVFLLRESVSTHFYVENTGRDYNWRQKRETKQCN